MLCRCLNGSVHYFCYEVGSRGIRILILDVDYLLFHAKILIPDPYDQMLAQIGFLHCTKFGIIEHCALVQSWRKFHACQASTKDAQ